MKILRLIFGRKKKLRPKKQKKVESPVLPLTYSTSFFESKDETKKVVESNADFSELQEIILPEKSNIDLDDDSQIEFVPEQEIIPPKEEIIEDNSSHQEFEKILSSNANEDNLPNKFEVTTDNKITLESEGNYEEKLREKSHLLEETNSLNNKIQSLSVQSEGFDRVIEEKQRTINQLEEKINILQTEIETNIENKIKSKKAELEKLEKEFSLKQEELRRVDSNNAELILQTEKQFKDKILEFNSIITQKEKEIAKLDSELIILSKNFEAKKSEIHNWEEENRINQERIQKSREEIANLEMRVIEIHSEAKELLIFKDEIYSEILKLQEELTKLKTEKDKTVELIHLSQKRRDEIEFSNDQLEKRLLRMIQKFDDEIKELSTHKANIEKRISELQNKIDENENIINEKLNLLKNTEDKLRLRQTELNSINNLIENLSEKEELLAKSISEYEKEIYSKKTDNQELRKDIDLLTQKKSSIEKILEELFISSEQRINRMRETQFKTDNEIRQKELLYEEITQKIEKSIDELVELQKSVRTQKVELENLNIKTENLKNINESLEKEIQNKNKVLEQFIKIKNEISDGSSEIRKDFSKEFGINKDEFESDPNQKKIFRL